MNVRYLDIAEVFEIHERMIQIGAGRPGIRDFTLLHSAVERPKASFSGRLLYTSLFTQAASLMQSIVKNHAFNDGNKRTGFFSTIRFLYLNGHKITAPKDTIVKFCLHVDTKNLTVEEIAAWFKKHSVYA